MRIRFEPENQRCEFEKGDLKLSFLPCDRTDIMVGWKRLGVVIPPDAWKEETVSGRIVRLIDRSLVSADDCRKLEQDDDSLLALKLVSAEGLEFEDGINIETLSERDKTDLISLLRQSIPEFNLWCAQYVRGGEKKSGRMAID